MFVSENGEDRADCGHDLDTPCRTLPAAIRTSSPDDVILLDALRGTGRFMTCGELNIVDITKDITITGFRGVASIGCDPTDSRGTLYNIDGGDTIINVTLANVTLSNTNMMLDNVNLHLEYATLNDSKIYSTANSSQSDHIGFSVLYSRWYGVPPTHFNSSEANTLDPIIRISAKYLYLKYYNSQFYHQMQEFRVSDRTDFTISHILFGSLTHGLSIHGGIYLTVSRTGMSRVLVEDSIFRDQVSFDPINSIRNLFQAAFYVRATKPGPEPDPRSNATVVISRCQFLHNERGLTFIGPLDKPHVIDCTFLNNIAMHAGAGILYLVEPGVRSYVTNSTFKNNAAGKYRPESITNYTETFQINGDEVRIHSECCKGVISFVGKGGAIRVQRGILYANNCNFVNNTARLLGGAVFVDRESEMYIDGSYLENSKSHTHALQGDLIYSDGKVTIRDVQFLVQTAASHVAVLRHSGDHWSINVTDVSLQCPVGYRLRITNTSAYGVHAYGLMRSYMMDQLSYFCESCPRNKYSLDFGFLNYSLVYSKTAYYTLLIDGNEPQAAYNGTYTYHDIECLECPYGARCQNGITAVPNFWGYTQDSSTLAFQHCPRGYCCSSTECPDYNTCAVHRTGELCGRCNDDYSEALFSSQCVPNNNCSSTWLWPLAIMSGLMYFLFLLFQKDIRDLIFASTMSWKEMPCCKSKILYSSTNNHASADEALTNPLQDTEFDIMDHEMSVNINGVKRNNNVKPPEQDEGADEPAANPDTGASFLIILFYYFQDAQLLHIHTVFALAEGQNKSMLKTILSGLFKFRLELFQFVDKVCFLSHLRPHTKLIIQVFMVPYVLFQFGVVYFMYQCNRRMRSQSVHTSISQHNTTSTPPRRDDSSKTAKRLATGFVLSLLFTYQKLATTCFTLLNCVPVSNRMVLYIEGTITCYELWQYGAMAYVGACIVPFCLTLLLGPGLLKDGLIGLPQFFCACIFPAPFLIYWVIIRLKLRGQRPNVDNVHLSDEAQAVINILQGPFKDTESSLFGPTCGQGILIGRRLVLVILYTFVNDPLIRMLCMMLVCFIILLHHVHVLPFKDTKGNLAGSTSAAALLVMGVINLVRAGFEAAEYTPQGPNEVLMYVFEEVEDVLMLWFPLGVMIIVFVSLGVNFAMTFLRCMFRDQSRHVPEAVPNTPSTTI